MHFSAIILSLETAPFQFFNFLQSVIREWLLCELVWWKRHCCHFMYVPQMPCGSRA